MNDDDLMLMIQQELGEIDAPTAETPKTETPPTQNIQVNLDADALAAKVGSQVGQQFSSALDMQVSKSQQAAKASVTPEELFLKADEARAEGEYAKAAAFTAQATKIIQEQVNESSQSGYNHLMSQLKETQKTVYVNQIIDSEGQDLPAAAKSEVRNILNQLDPSALPNLLKDENSKQILSLMIDGAKLRHASPSAPGVSSAPNASKSSAKAQELHSLAEEFLALTPGATKADALAFAKEALSEDNLRQIQMIESVRGR